MEGNGGISLYNEKYKEYTPPFWPYPVLTFETKYLSRRHSHTEKVKKSKTETCWNTGIKSKRLILIFFIYYSKTKKNKATQSPEISRQQIQKLTPQFLLYIYIGYRFPLSISTIWGNHLPVNFMLKFPTCISTIWRNHLPRREMRKNCFPKKNLTPPPPQICFDTKFV